MKLPLVHAAAARADVQKWKPQEWQPHEQVRLCRRLAPLDRSVVRRLDEVFNVQTISKPLLVLYSEFAMLAFRLVERPRI